MVKHPTWAQVLISQFMDLSPMSGFVLTSQSLGPASDSVSLSLCSSPTLALSLSLKKKLINVKKIKYKKIHRTESYVRYVTCY